MSDSERISETKPDVDKNIRTSLIQKVDSSRHCNSFADNIIFFQRSVGNEAVGRIIRSGSLQAKLKIGQPGDEYEQEADRIAEQVMRMSEPQKISPNNFYIQRACSKCEENELKRQPTIEEEEEEKLQRQPVEDEEEEKLQGKTGSDFSPEIDPGVENHIQSMKGGGNPLSETERAFFEPRFGADFSHVRLHTDSKAAESAKHVNALAYTVGRDIVFGNEQYSPGSQEGKKLLAHELTHVIQQKGDETVINRWDNEGHKEITYKVANQVTGDGLFAIELSTYAGMLDTKWRRRKTLPAYLFGRATGNITGEGPDHGEDGNYTGTDEGSSAAVNKIMQNFYLTQALKYNKNMEALKKEGKPVHERGSVAEKMFDALGDACHVAQDRGSHGEGVKGKGHSDPREKGEWSTDNPADNPEGYQKAVNNTTQLIEEFQKRREST